MSSFVKPIPQKSNRLDKSQLKLDSLVRLLEALSDPTRLKILMVLVNGERSVGELVEELKLTQPTTSHHLGLLRMNNLVENRRDGKQIFYSVAKHVSRNGDEHFKIKIEGHDVVVGKPD